MSKIYVTGDFHGSLDIKKITNKNWPEQKELTKNDVLIQLGDFGLIWGNTKEEQYWLDWLGDKPFTFAFIEGNHENYHLLNQLPITEKWGGKVRIIHTNKDNNHPIYQLMRGEVYNINGKKILTLGGADSQDKAYRTENINWWKEEAWSYSETDYIISQVIKHNGKFDYVLSHTCPNSVGVEYLYIINKNVHSKTIEYYEGKCNCSVGNAMQVLIDKFNLTCKQWHYGHWHDDWYCIKGVIEYFCHYKKKPYLLGE